MLLCAVQADNTTSPVTDLSSPPQVLGQGAVHGAFAGYTGLTVGLVNTHYVYLPIPVIIQARAFSCMLEAVMLRACHGQGQYQIQNCS